ncbi:MAG: hypothetical protein V2I33_11180 [Kangiellaceae bacterium]|jgi:hypothetical protein|nr:hypothetical protein [Kangiellaceae bacterium]
MMIRLLVVFVLSVLLLSCSTYRPANTENICNIFRGELDWYEDARDAQKHWGTPVYVMMAIMHQESKFQHDVHAPRDYILGFIPWGYKSSAYGFAQAKDEVWGEFQTAVDYGADRDDFYDAINFIGWYTHGTQQRLNVSKWDTYNQYLAYHEGRGGFSRKTYEKKPWLKKVAKKVQNQAMRYKNQLASCRKRLDDAVDSWF